MSIGVTTLRGYAVCVTLMIHATAATPAAQRDANRLTDARGDRRLGAAVDVDSRFVPVTVLPHGSLDEPMAFDLARDGRLYVIERKGALKVKYPHEAEARTVARLPVNTTYQEGPARRESQKGLLGIALDPRFELTGWVYVLYAATDASEHRVARWQVKGDQLIVGSERIVLRYPVDRDVCCHFGGGMTWDGAGNLYIAVGSNTAEPLIRGEFQFAASDERPGRASWDAQRTAANSNDLRGKILRIHPEPDGSYTIPPGNLFPPGQANTRPEIFTMGHRNPWHPSVDVETGWLYWGEVGPDRRTATSATPPGFDELNVAKGPGFFGWPYFVGDNTPYAVADLVNNRFGGVKDPERPQNHSINNTGLRELPAAQPALIAYSAESVAQWPALGSGGGCAMGGPIYRRSLANAAPRRVWPEPFEGKWIVTDCARRWILVVGLDPSGAPRSVEPLDVDYRPTIPVDMKVDRQGDLYVLEYGSSILGRAPDARLVRIEYRAGNRSPVAVARSDKTAGRAPLTVRLSGNASSDPDRDTLRYRWVVQAQDGRVLGRYDTASSVATFALPGSYKATLTVTDRNGGSDTSVVPIFVGNEPPSISLEVRSPSTTNATFVPPGSPIEYVVRIEDREDGAVAAPDPGRVAVSIDQIGEDEDVGSVVPAREGAVTPLTRFRVARQLMDVHRCAQCHARSGPSHGPRAWRSCRNATGLIPRRFASWWHASGKVVRIRGARTPCRSTRDWRSKHSDHPHLHGEQRGIRAAAPAARYLYPGCQRRPSRRSHGCKSGLHRPRRQGHRAADVRRHGGHSTTTPDSGPC